MKEVKIRAKSGVEQPEIHSKYIAFFLKAICCLAFISGNLVWATKPTSDSVSFHFFPTLDREFWQYSEQRRSTEVGESSHEVHAYTVERTIFTKDSSGLIIRSDVDSMFMSRDGVEITDTIMKSLSATSSVGRLDTNGVLLSAEVPNIASLLDPLRSRMNPALFDQIASSLSAEAIYQKIKADWEFSIEQFSGRTMAVGDTFSSESDFKLPSGGVMHFKSSIVLDSICQCSKESNIDCASLHYWSTASDSGSLSGFFEKLNSSAGGSEGDPPQFTSTSQTATGTLILDPATLNKYYDERNRSIVVSQFGQKSSTATTNETRTTRLFWRKP